MGRRRRTAPAAALKSDVELVKDRAAKALSRTDAEARVRVLEDRLARIDRWVNPATGLGTLEDKTRAGHFEFPWRLMDQEITALISGNDLAAKIVEKRPAEMFRRGYRLTGKAKGGSTVKGGADKSQLDDLQAYAQKLNVDLRMREGMTYGRQYGGSLLILGIQDGRPPWQPVDENNIQSVRFINQLDRRFAYVQSYYSDYMSPKYGEAQTYLVSNGVATSSYRSEDGSKFRLRKKGPETLAGQGNSTLNIHESRVIRFDGVEPDVLTRQTLAGWSWSVLQRVYEVLRLVDGSFDALAYLISDASQGVIKLKGLFAAMSSGNEDKMQTRLQMIEDMRSVMRSIALDTEGGEDFTRVTTPLTGIPDSIDRIMQRLSAAADMPNTELWGISPAGLNATGESDRIKWYDTIKVEQKNYLAPKLSHLYRLMALANDSPFRGKATDFDIEFHSLYSPTDDELAKTRYTNAQRDALYITNEVVTPAQVALTLTEVYDSIEPEELEAEIDAKTKFDPYEKDPNASDQVAAKQQQQAATAKTKALQLAAKAKMESQPAGSAAGSGVPESQSPAVPLAGGQPKTGTKAEDRADFDEGEERDETGKWTGGGGGGAAHATTPAGLHAAEAYRKQSDPRFKSLKRIGAALRAAPRELGKAVLGEVKEKIKDVKNAGHGVLHFLEGNPVSAEEKKAIKHVAVTVATSIVAGHLAPLLHLGAIAGESAFVEKAADQVLHHFLEKFANRAFRLDAWSSTSDPSAWLADTILKSLADAYDQVHDDTPTGSERSDFDPDQPRDERGQFASSGGGGGASGKLKTALSPPKQSEVGRGLGEGQGKALGEDEAFEQGFASAGPSPHLTVPGYGAKNNPELVSQRIAEPLVARATAQGGFSYRPGAKSPKTGFMVSLPTTAGANHVIDIESMAHRDPPPSEKELRAEVSGRVRDWLRSTLPSVQKNPDHYLGGWLQKGDDGKPVALHLDVSQRFTDHDKATAAGRDRNQIAIWNLDEGKEIPTGGSGK